MHLAAPSSKCVINTFRTNCARNLAKSFQACRALKAVCPSIGVFNWCVNLWFRIEIIRWTFSPDAKINFVEFHHTYHSSKKLKKKKEKQKHVTCNKSLFPLFFRNDHWGERARTRPPIVASNEMCSNRSVAKNDCVCVCVCEKSIIISNDKQLLNNLTEFEFCSLCARPLPNAHGCSTTDR